MNSLPRGRTGQLCAVGVLIGLLVIAYVAAIDPAISYYGERADELTVKGALIQRYRQLALTTPTAKTEAETPQKNTQPAFLTGASDALATAKLQTAVDDLLANARLPATSFEVLASDTKSDLQQFGIRVVFNCRLSPLVRFLESVEAARPILLADNLEIRSNAASATDEHPELAVSVDIFGFREPIVPDVPQPTAGAVQ